MCKMYIASIYAYVVSYFRWEVYPKMGSKYTDAQKNASIKYLDEKTDSIQIRTPKGTKERWREAATAAGTSLNRYIMDAVEEKIEKHPK